MSDDKNKPGAVRLLTQMDAKLCQEATRRAQEKKVCDPDMSIFEYCETLYKYIQEATTLGASETPWLVFKGDPVTRSIFELWLKDFSAVRGFQIWTRIDKTDPLSFSVRVAWLDDKGVFSVS